MAKERKKQAPRKQPGKKYFTPAEANATLPLVRAIVKDISDLANVLRDRQERLARLQQVDRDAFAQAYQEELDQAQTQFEQERDRMAELFGELKSLGIELKDYFAGLVDFPCWMDGREVCLCWKLGEEEVGWWHELEAGFAGRQMISATSGVG